MIAATASAKSGFFLQKLNSSITLNALPPPPPAESSDDDSDGVDELTAGATDGLGEHSLGNNSVMLGSGLVVGGDARSQSLPDLLLADETGDFGPSGHVADVGGDARGWRDVVEEREDTRGWSFISIDSGWPIRPARQDADLASAAEAAEEQEMKDRWIGDGVLGF
ncbi:uncharacterized protein A4U43_C05F17260 [Asparagus officinalis]|uniref:Uncharacterized protein n=1 Tax=Asparagus officinalis TaxID=4686 RepID=A0A5P1ES87_ASPOF|nr:uncharacterized protein A4U43_C05F17260 [Asparagus officinalis]